MLKNQKAFTLIELMMSLLIAGVILAFAVPSFNTQIVNNRSVALGEELGAALNFARSEAVKRNARVSVCASNNGTGCVGNWKDGYIAFLDMAVTDTAPAVVVGTVLQHWSVQDSSRTTINSTATFIRYTGLGTLAQVNAGPITIDSWMDHCSGNAARKITIGISGMAATERTTCP